MTDAITVLSHSSLLLAKRWRPDGSISAYDNAKHYTVRDVPVASFADLSKVLSILEKRPKSCVIRGRYKGDAHAKSVLNGEYKEGLAVRQLECYDDPPRHWVLAEVDNFEPISCDPVEDPASACAEFVTTSLPDEFHTASYYWQLSNSAGHAKNAGKLKAHIWFWLVTPYTSGQLKAWAKHHSIGVDTSVFNPVQVHYTSAPVFDEGVADPVPHRSGVCHGATASVPLHIPADLPVTDSSATRRERMAAAHSDDHIAQALYDRGMVKRVGAKGELFIDCPRSEHHTGEGGETSTAYFPAHTGGYSSGAFKCLHAHCVDEPKQAFLEAMELSDDPSDDFDDLTESGKSQISDLHPGLTDAPGKARRKFEPMPFWEFATLPPGASYHIKGVLPVCDLAVLYGASGGGKSFAMMDMCFAVAAGVPWRGHKTTKGRVVYIVAEGARGARLRAMAYCRYHGIDPATIDMLILPAQPNLLKADDIRELIVELKKCGKVAMTVVDTLAQTTPGANENSGEDMGQVLSHCRKIAEILHCTVVLVHHSGKDAAKGARGWSGLRAAVDTELEVIRDEDDRVISVTKMKDGDEGATHGFKLLTVELGTDEDGDPITSCVVEHTDGGMPKKRAAKLGKVEKAVVEALEDLEAIGDALTPVETLLASACEKLQAPDEGKRDRRRDHCIRAIGELQKTARLVVEGGFVRGLCVD